MAAHVIKIEGNGDPNCLNCKGRGAVSDNVLVKGRVPGCVPCSCVSVRWRKQNMERGWVGLSEAEPAEETPLSNFTDKNLYLTIGHNDLRSHLHTVCSKKHHDWRFKVISDVDLARAWLYAAKHNGDVVYDADVAEAPESTSPSLEDLVLPSTLLVIILGKKASANKAMPDLLEEAIHTRQHVGKPTWVVDQPSYLLAAGHPCFSASVVDTLDEYGFKRGTVGMGNVPQRALPQQGKAPQTLTAQAPQGEYDGLREIEIASEAKKMMDTYKAKGWLKPGQDLAFFKERVRNQ